MSKYFYALLALAFTLNAGATEKFNTNTNFPEKGSTATKRYAASANLSNLVINEIQVANNGQFVDPSFNYGGWIEIYNAGTTTVDLGGAYVRGIDADGKNEQLFHLCSDFGTIPAGGYLNIWFDHNSIWGTYAYKQVEWKLEMEGGTITLLDSNLQEISSVTYPAAVPRTSYARTTDNGSTWGWTANPTPEETNSTTSYLTSLQRLDAPVVDQDGTVFAGTIKVNVEIPSGATLRYTTDGSVPTLTNGTTSPSGVFSFITTTTLRLCLYQDGYLPSPVVTRSYINLNYDYCLPIVSVVGKSEDFYDDTMGVMVKGTNGRAGNGQSTACNWNMDWERPVNFEYFVPQKNSDGDVSFMSVLNQEADLEMCGGWSRASSPHSFKIKASKQYELANYLNYAFFDSKPYIHNKVLQIRNGGNDYNCRIKDAALQEIVRRSGLYIDGQSWQPAHEFINGIYIGVLNIRQPNNKNHGQSEWGIDPDEMDNFEISPDSCYVQKGGTKEAYQKLYSLAKQVANKDTDAYAEVEKLLDIDEFCNYIAVEMYLGSNDWPRNNLKAYRSQDNGKFHFVLFDLDNALATTSAFNNFINQQYGTSDRLYGCSTQYIYNMEREHVTIFLNLMQNDEFRKHFIDTYCIVAGSVFEPTRCKEIITEMANTMYAGMSITGESPWNTANTLINALSSSRQKTMITSDLYSYLKNKHGETPNQYYLNLSSNISEARLLLGGQEIPTRKFGGYAMAPITLTAKAPAGYKFLGWSQSGYSASSSATTYLPSSTQWKYYAEGSLDNTDWKSSTYNDGSWSSGQQPLGYGKTGLSTTVSSGLPCYYFRTSLTLDSTPGSSDNFTLNYTADDGFIVYVNGTEACRYNMPSGTVTYSTYATTYAENNPDTGTLTLAASLFKKGTNVIAVEVHNNSATSSDIYWSATLTGATTTTSYISTDETFVLSNLESAGTYTLVAQYEKIEDGTKSYEAGATPIRINEVSAGNDIYHNDHWEKSDWIELYNTTDEDIDVAGMYLSDNTKKTQKYQIPASDEINTIVPAHGTRIIWCDGLEQLTQMHSPFKLDNADGAYVSIQSEDGTWADQMTYLAQPRWHTYGRYPDGGNHESLMAQPTIDKSNMLGTFDFTSVSDEEWNGDDITITLALAEGWNWMSHNLASMVDHSRFTGYAQTILSQTEELYYDEDFGWQGRMTQLDPQKGYKVLMKEGADITLRGDIYDTSNSVELSQGWNWIGFPLYNATELSTALQNYTPSEGDRIVSIDGVSTYEDGEWGGTISSLYPGQGYLLKTNSAQDFTWNSLSSVNVKKRRYTAPSPRTKSPWELNLHAYPNVMNVIARLEINGEEAMDGSYSLGAFSGDECRGVATLSNGLLYITIHGQGGEPIKFRLFDAEGKTFDIDQSYTLISQDLIGSRKSPLLLTVTTDETDAISNVALGSKILSVQYYSLSGQRLARPSGICIQKTIYAGGHTVTHKFIQK